MIAGKHGQKRCLSGAVGTNKVPARIGSDSPIDVLENLKYDVSKQRGSVIDASHSTVPVGNIHTVKINECFIGITRFALFYLNWRVPAGM